MTECAEINCHRPVYADGWCKKHRDEHEYQRPPLDPQTAPTHPHIR